MQFNVGGFYAKEIGIKRDLNKAVYWMKRAVANREEGLNLVDFIGLFVLVYERGRDLTENKEKNDARIF